MRNILNFRIVILLVLTLCCLITSCNRSTDVQNPPTRWTTSPDGSPNAKPRNQIYKPDGRTVHPDTDVEQDGNPTGVVFFGPTSNKPTGASDSKAVAEFKCGENGANCEVEIWAGSGSTNAAAKHEYLVMTLEKLDDAGRPTGQSDRKEHSGVDSSKGYTLRVRGCGNVRVTLSFRENVNQDNPDGIQTGFNANIKKYACTR